MPPKYPRQQLKSVSIELFFPGQLEALGVLGSIQREVSADLPVLFVPNVQPGEAPALRPFQLRNAAGTRSLALAVNQATYIAFNDYPGFDAFTAEALPFLTSVLARVQAPQLNRIRYVYENEVGLPDQEGFEVGSIFPGVLPSAVANAEGRKVLAPFQAAAEWISSKDLVGFNARIEGPNPVLKVAVFATVREPTLIENLPAAIARIHVAAVALFESLISPEFRVSISEQDS